MEPKLIENKKAKYRKMIVFVTPFASYWEGMKDLLVLLGKKKEAIEIERIYQKRKLLGPWVKGIEKTVENLQNNTLDRLTDATLYYCKRKLLKGIREFSQELSEQNFLVGAITSDPQFMMDVVKKEARLDFAYGTKTEFESKIATGNVLKNLDRYDKAELVEKKAKEFDIPKEKIVIMGEASIVHLPIAEKSHIFIGFDPVKDDLIKAIRKNKKLSSIFQKKGKE